MYKRQEENRIISIVEENQEIMSNTNNEDNTNSKLKEMKLSLISNMGRYYDKARIIAEVKSSNGGRCV